MQRLLEQSYAASRHVSAQDFDAAFHRDGNDEDDEAAMLEAAIRASLESHGAPDNAMKEGGAKDGAADPRSDADIQVDEEALARALELSTQLDRDSKTLNQDIIDVQIASLVESHPEEVVMQTISIFDEMRERYEKDGGALPSVDDALAQAERQVKQRKQQEETQAAHDLQFQEFADSLSPEVMAEARQIFEDLSKEMAESGGRAPTVEYAISLAQDRAKARRAEQQRQEAAEEKRREEAREAEEKQKQEERDQEANERKRETREERAARIAASYARK
ncbi:Hypothetical Protein FCC1311_003542 [Hondaea fermentalgiana]|uniref:Uncharacterized protein n=1 Tax=Hondaea fermentalgiana TaxID=2315210 RepID=A0A2R5FZF0_9STRA|nr:Hypothetical Protein FCC1311_003542 [Hondaea fermentalgiana]|eukprot:GBG24136.1 Hypothetical Protein FCC1311_003542 [Hondaea fermentalgiana]